MNRSFGCLCVGLLVVLVAAGCNNAKSPDTVAKDVNSAAQSADAKSAKEEEKAEQRIASAEGDVTKEKAEEQHVAAVQAENVAETDAAGRRKIDLAKCEALSSDQQKTCKDRANAVYDMAVAQAKQDRAERDPKR